ncbi:MAG: (d)CMP kinase [Pirellulales bacterium]
MIVTIDGPAGAGKSSAARALAQRLGFRFLDTGAMYRAVAWAAVDRQVDWHQPDALAELTSDVSIDLTDDNRVLVDGRDITQEIRTSEITLASRYAADNSEVRARLVELQRQEAQGGNIVTEGRDQGTVVFPDADCKIFLTATAEARASRRYDDLLASGESITFEQVLADQQQRDLRDESRPVGGLKKADDAIELWSDELTADQVVDRLEEIVRACS